MISKLPLSALLGGALLGGAIGMAVLVPSAPESAAPSSPGVANCSVTPPPCDQDFYRPYTVRTGTVTAWADCNVTIDFGNGDVRTFFAGLGEKDTAPAIGKSVEVMVTGNGTCPQTLFYLKFADSPYTQSTPEPSPTPSV